MMLLVQLALLCLVPFAASHRHGEWRCDHTASSHNITYRVGMRHHGSKSTGYHHIAKRALDQPFRMYVYYDSSTSGLQSSTLAIIQDTINNLKDFYQRTLLIRATEGPILLERTCNAGGFFPPTSGSDDRQCAGTCATTTRCGSITTVPEDHLKACIQCNGEYPQCETVGSDGAGVSDADFVLYVSATTTGLCPNAPSPQGTIAFAGACQMESEYDRPIAGFVNFCPQSLTGDDIDDDFVLAVAKHEILHALAFSSGLYAWWRDSNGDPRTPRNTNGFPTELDSSGLYVPSQNTLKTVTYEDWQTRNGELSHTVTMLVTPRIADVAQSHFNCSSLEGMEVENQGGGGTAFSHWEKRLVENEGMTGIVSDEAVFSRFTFALLEDSGWYRVDYSMAGQLVWGNNLGCEFVSGSCGGFIKSQQDQNRPITPFCNRLSDNSRHGCTITRNAVSFCNLGTYTDDLPNEYQYFESGENFDSSDTTLSRIGGGTQIADYCPFQMGFSNAVCSDAANDKGTGFSNLGGQSFGAGARCVLQGDPWSASTGPQTLTATSFGAGCYQYSCVESRVLISVFDTTYTCTEKGTTIDVEVTESGVTHRGTLICPACTEICYDDFDNCPEAAELFAASDPTETVATTESSGHVSVASSSTALVSIVLAAVMNRIMQ